MKPTILEAIKHRPLLGDGAMGTQLMFAGLEQGACGEAWNITHPEKVLAIQRRYAEAGSDCILTNTFGGTRIMLNRHGCRDKVVEVNQAAVRIAREAFGDRDGYVIGDMGPFGGLMEPYGDFSESDVRSAFNEQARALAASPQIAGIEKPAERIGALFRRVLGRQPAKTETASALRFIEAAKADAQPEKGLTPWEQLAQVMLISNEAVFLD